MVELEERSHAFSDLEIGKNCAYLELLYSSFSRSHKIGYSISVDWCSALQPLLGSRQCLL